MNPASPDALRQKIWQLLAEKEEAAVRTAIDLIPLLPQPSSEPDELTAQCIFDAGFGIERFGDDTAAVGLYRRVLLYPVVNPKYIASAWFRVGVCVGRQGNLEEAVGCYREALRLSANEPHLTGIALYYLAGLREADEGYGEAADLYARLLPMLPHPDINPNQARLRYARCCCRIGKQSQARTELSALANQPELPESAEAWLLLAEIAENEGQHREAEKAYRGIIESPHAEDRLRAAAAYKLARLPKRRGR